MIDFAHITVCAGKGGDGSGSRTQIKGKRYGRADGGDGGRGGNVYLLASTDLNNLEAYRYLRHYEAKNGVNGFANLRRGATGEDLVLKVPVGTLAKVESMGPVSSFLPASARSGRKSDRSGSGQSELRAAGNLSTAATHNTFVIDLIEDGQKVLLARGGEGGRGNAHLRDEFGRRPRVGERGEAGEKLDLTLELKLIADVGLIGLPNAGKSTLLAALTAAKPTIAAYPFTTLEPNLGVLETGPVSSFSLPASARSVRSSDQRGEDKPELRADGSLSRTATRSRIVIADIPGLIEGASTGKGLGDLFLRHIERTKILVHLIDISTSVDVWKDYQTIRNELKTYSKELVKKKEIVVLNKIDLADRETVEKIAEEFKLHRKKVLAISAQKGIGTSELVKEIFKKL